MRNGFKATLVSGAALLTAFGVATAVAVPANADPANPNPTKESQELALVGVGSDTIQDLFTGLSRVVTDGTAGTPVIASYDATGSAQIKTRVLGQEFDRPNGSGPGRDALKSAVAGSTVKDNGANVVLHGSDVQFARSSSFNNGSALSDSGRYAQIPIAVDAVTYATNGGTNGTKIPSGIPEGGSPAASDGTTAAPAALTLANIFGGKGYLSGTVGGTTYKFYSGTGASSDQTNWPKLDVFVPQSGSGTRNFWYQALNLGTNTALPNGVLDQFNGKVNEEHDGTALDGDPLAIEPFSIAQWNAQSTVAALNGKYGTNVTDRRHNAVLNSVADSTGAVVSPTTSGKLNTAFPISRPVFVIVEYAALKINPYLKAAFVSNANFALNKSIYDAVATSGRTNTITDFGFAKIPAAGFTTPVYPGVTFKQGDADDYRFN